MRVGDRMVMPQNSKRLQSITIYFAVSNVLKKPEWMMARSTNSKDLLTFLSQISAKRTDPYSGKRLHLVLDRHPSHYCEKNGVRKVLRQQYSAHILPKASSWYNSAEWLFANLKREIRKHFVQRKEDVVDMDQFAADVAEVTARVSSRLQHSRIFFANLSELRKSMADELADDDEEAKESDSCLLQQGSSRKRGRCPSGSPRDDARSFRTRSLHQTLTPPPRQRGVASLLHEHEDYASLLHKHADNASAGGDRILDDGEVYIGTSDQDGIVSVPVLYEESQLNESDISEVGPAHGRSLTPPEFWAQTVLGQVS